MLIINERPLSNQLNQFWSILSVLSLIFESSLTGFAGQFKIILQNVNNWIHHYNICVET